jgi:opacity protein-like surface antigen
MIVDTIKFNILFPLFILISSTCLAKESSLFDLQKDRALATITLGPDFVQSGQSQTLTLLPPFQNHYTNGSQNQVVFDGGGFLGIERTLSEQFTAQLGIAGYGDSVIKSQGEIWQFNLPNFNGLSYSYKVRHARVMAAGKLLGTFPIEPAIKPYISFELGAAFNKASEYQETILVPGYKAMSPFSNNSQTSFSWGVGLGYDFSINAHIRIGMGYQFSDLGKASLGPSLDSITSNSLVLSHLYTNQLRFQLTYLV